MYSLIFKTRWWPGTCPPLAVGFLSVTVCRGLLTAHPSFSLPRSTWLCFRKSPLSRFAYSLWEGKRCPLSSVAGSQVPDSALSLTQWLKDWSPWGSCPHPDEMMGWSNATNPLLFSSLSAVLWTSSDSPVISPGLEYSRMDLCCSQPKLLNRRRAVYRRRQTCPRRRQCIGEERPGPALGAEG